MPNGEAEQVDDLLGARADQVSAKNAAGSLLSIGVES